MSNNLLQLLAVKPDCDRTLIPNLNSHRSTKYPTGDSEPITSNSLLEVLNEGFCNCRRRRIRKAGSPASTRIGIEGELRDDQNFSTNIEKRAVHLAFIVTKDAQVDYLISQGLYLKLAILLPDSEQYQQSLTYLAHNLSLNSDAGTAHSL